MLIPFLWGLTEFNKCELVTLELAPMASWDLANLWFGSLKKKITFDCCSASYLFPAWIGPEVVIWAPGFT
jgi:hypothetical protein